MEWKNGIRGKTSKELVRLLERSAYISGDDVVDYATFPKEADWLVKDTDSYTAEQINEIIESIKNDERFLVR